MGRIVHEGRFMHTRATHGFFQSPPTGPLCFVCILGSGFRFAFLTFYMFLFASRRSWRCGSTRAATRTWSRCTRRAWACSAFSSRPTPPACSAQLGSSACPSSMAGRLREGNQREELYPKTKLIAASLYTQRQEAKRNQSPPPYHFHCTFAPFMAVHNQPHLSGMTARRPPSGLKTRSLIAEPRRRHSLALSGIQSRGLFRREIASSNNHGCMLSTTTKIKKGL